VAAGAVLTLLAVTEVGCGSSSTRIAPFMGVWVANGGGANALHYSGNQITTFTGVFNIPPVTVLNTKVFVAPQDTTFGSTGTMWVVDGGANDGKGTGAAVYAFVAAQLASLNSNSAPTPGVVVKPVSAGGANLFNFPQFAALDASGNLWVSDSANNVIFRFNSATIKTALVLSPDATFGSAAFNAPLGIAFDSGGNLWVCNNGGTTIVEIASAALTGTGPVAVVPATTLNSDGAATPSINNPWGILFDANGNLWFTNEQLKPPTAQGSGTVVEFTAASIKGGGTITPAPNVTLTAAAVGGTTSFSDPNGISMNNLGNITVANAANSSLAEFTASQISTTGNPVPHTFIVGGATTLNGPTGLSYGPLSLQ
jgi:streptogramin lyase